MKTIDGYNHLFKLSLGHLVSQSIYVVSRLGIADILKEAPLGIEELARRSKSNEDYLNRIMRILISNDIFTKDDDGKYRINDTADWLATDGEHTYKDFALFINHSPAPFLSLSKLFDTMETGKLPFDEYHGVSAFDYVAKDPELAILLDKAMLSAHTMASKAFLDNYDLSQYRTFADIGGGRGEATSQVLKRYPSLKAKIFDLPHVVERTKKHFYSLGFGERCEFTGGSFFESIPVESEIYFMRQVLHDWNYDQCVTILKNLRASGKVGVKLLVSDCLVGHQKDSDNTLYYDLLMLYITGGRERTVEEFRELFDASGFKLNRCIETGFWFGLIEAEMI